MKRSIVGHLFMILCVDNCDRITCNCTSSLTTLVDPNSPCLLNACAKQICGAVLSFRMSQDMLAIWSQDARCMELPCEWGCKVSGDAMRGMCARCMGM